MELENRLTVLEKTVARLEKLVDGNGDSLWSKFDRKYETHLTESDRRFRMIEERLGDINSKVQVLNHDCLDLQRNQEELEKLIRERENANNAFRTQLLILLSTTILNLILGAVRIFGGG